MIKKRYSYDDLLAIMKKLRSKEGCPWDREQDHKSLKKYLIEETYEVLEAIDLEDKDKLCEELGDVLLQVVFHAAIAEENKQFDMSDIIDGLSKKLVFRHQHVFGDADANTADDVVDLWEKIKKKEKGAVNQTSILKDVPANLPALMRSYKVQQKAAQVGFDWDDVSEAFHKIDEEKSELEEAIKNGNKVKIEEEFGDLLFAAVNVSRFLKVNPEIALSGTINKFINRFEYVENEAQSQGRKLEDMTLKEMDVLWDKAKAKGI